MDMSRKGTRKTQASTSEHPDNAGGCSNDQAVDDQPTKRTRSSASAGPAAEVAQKRPGEATTSQAALTPQDMGSSYDKIISADVGTTYTVVAEWSNASPAQVHVFLVDC